MPEHDIPIDVHRFSAEMPRHFDHATGVSPRVQIGPADAAGQRLDEHLTRARTWFGQRISDDLAFSENGSAQLSSPGVVGVLAALPSFQSTDRRRAKALGVTGTDHALGDNSPSSANNCERLIRSRCAV